MAPYQPKYPWSDTLPGESGLEGKPLRDYVATVDGNYAGRVRFEARAGLLVNVWQWSGSWPKTFHGTPLMPNQGYERSLREACRKCEEYYDKMASLIPAENAPHARRDPDAGEGP